jgi:alpha-glucosidase (family GH31 glycosyl hydrolase)
MEDFGEYTPLDSYTHRGAHGAAAHNRYPVEYHCAAYTLTAPCRPPIVRFQRSGWTGAARCATVVWGGDPTTQWGFDGLASVVSGGLGMGLSGVSRWGSDIGGFFGLFGKQLTGELLARWVAARRGERRDAHRARRLRLPAYTRPQVEDDGQIANWRRWAKFRTQLYPYLRAADAIYRFTGLPIMRHLLLEWPEDTQAVASDDEFLFGPDLLAAPVLEPGATSRDVYLPAGAWIDLWRAAAYDVASGGLTLGHAIPVSGGRRVSVPAPADELPLFVRAGAVLVLLPPDVDTLADYGASSPRSFDWRTAPISSSCSPSRAGPRWPIPCRATASSRPSATAAGSWRCRAGSRAPGGCRRRSRHWTRHSLRARSISTVSRCRPAIGGSIRRPRCCVATVLTAAGRLTTRRLCE